MITAGREVGVFLLYVRNRRRRPASPSFGNEEARLVGDGRERRARGDCRADELGPADHWKDLGFCLE